MPANVKCTCGGHYRTVYRDLYRCRKCHDLLEQSPSAGWREVYHAMGVAHPDGDGR